MLKKRKRKITLEEKLNNIKQKVNASTDFLNHKKQILSRAKKQLVDVEGNANSIMQEWKDQQSVYSNNIDEEKQLKIELETTKASYDKTYAILKKEKHKTNEMKQNVKDEQTKVDDMNSKLNALIDLINDLSKEKTTVENNRLKKLKLKSKYQKELKLLQKNYKTLIKKLI